MFLTTSSNVTVPDSSGISNLTGTIAHANGSNKITGTTTAFLSEVNIGDFLVIGTVIRKVRAVNKDTEIYLTSNMLSSASGVTIKAITAEEGYRDKVSIRAIGGSIAISTLEHDNQALTTGETLVLESAIGVSPLFVNVSGNSAEIAY
jgi:hypothetical protein